MVTSTEKLELVNLLFTSVHPVEREIARFLIGKTDCDTNFRLYRYHRKIDIAHAVMTEYDEKITSAATDVSISNEAYCGLAHIFTEAAQRENQTNATGRAQRLLWINSAFNCLDHFQNSHQKYASGLEAELTQLLSETCAT